MLNFIEKHNYFEKENNTLRSQKQLFRYFLELMRQVTDRQAEAES